MAKKNLTISEPTGHSLTVLLVKHSAELNELLTTLQPTLQAAEFDAVRGTVGRILGETYVTALYPIYAQYPALRPAGFPGASKSAL